MRYVPDSTKLAQLAIPGTHDSAAWNIPADVGETQDWSPNTQLNNGNVSVLYSLIDNTILATFNHRYLIQYTRWSFSVPS